MAGPFLVNVSVLWASAVQGAGPVRPVPKTGGAVHGQWAWLYQRGQVRPARTGGPPIWVYWVAGRRSAIAICTRK